jgi:hypothetical protein
MITVNADTLLAEIPPPKRIPIGLLGAELTRTASATIKSQILGENSKATLSLLTRSAWTQERLPLSSRHSTRHGEYFDNARQQAAHHPEVNSKPNSSSHNHHVPIDNEGILYYKSCPGNNEITKPPTAK